MRLFSVIFSLLWLGNVAANQSYSFEKIEFSTSKTFPMSKTVCDRGECTAGGVKKNQIILTFDDGPGKHTSKTLDVLKKYDIKGTFFVHVGQWEYRNYSSTRAIMDRMYNEGHKISNHGRQHDPLHRSTRGATVLEMLTDTHNVIERYQDPNDIMVYRNPGGYWASDRARMLNRHPIFRNYVGPIFWNVGGSNVWRNGTLRDAADWQCQRDKMSSTTCANGYYNSIMSNYRRNEGSLVLLHDIHNITAPMLDKLLNKLLNNGIDWEFIFVQDIPAVKNMQTMI